MTKEEIQQYITEHKLDTKSRIRERVYQRAFLCSHLRENTTKSLEQIGKMFNRDHSTVIHLINNVHKRYIEINDKEYSDSTKSLRASLKYKQDQTKVNFEAEFLKCESLIEFHRLQKQLKETL